MKTIKYLFLGAMLMGISTPVLAQDGTAADVDAVKKIIKSKPADLDKQLKPFYSKNKKNAANLVAFGRAFYEEKDTANARVYANYALKADKKFGAAYVLLGDVAALGEDGGGAASFYDQAIYFDPKNPDAYKKYAAVYRKIDPAGAVQKLEDLRVHRPDFPVDALIGHINYQSLRYSSAIEAYSKVPVAQMDRTGFIEYAMSNYHARQYDKSLSIVKDGLKKEPMNATLNRIAMMSANELKQFEEALRYADILFNKVDKDSVTLSDIDYQNWGKALDGNQQFEEAIAKYNQALALPELEAGMKPTLFKAISDSYKGLKNYPSAIEYYKKYLEENVEADATDYAGLGILNNSYARTLEGEAKDSVLAQTDQVYAQLIEKFADAEEYALWQRGRINAQRDTDMSQALANPHFTRLAELITAHETLDETDKNRLFDAYAYLMRYNNKMKNNEAALDYAKKLLEIRPDDADIQNAVEVLSKSVK